MGLLFTSLLTPSPAVAQFKWVRWGRGLPGLVAANEERWAEAERFFAIVIQQEGGASAWSNLGNVHLSQGRPEVALDDFTHAISLAPQVQCLPISCSNFATHILLLHLLRPRFVRKD